MSLSYHEKFFKKLFPSFSASYLSVLILIYLLGDVGTPPWLCGLANNVVVIMFFSVLVINTLCTDGVVSGMLAAIGLYVFIIRSSQCSLS